MSTTLNGNPKPLASVITYLPFGGITGLTYGNNLTLVRGYDNQYRTSSIAVGSLLSRAYGYDPNGNVTSIIDSIEPAGNQALEKTGTYTYETGTNLLTQITGEDPKVFDYDQNANTTLENNRGYIYDASNQLIRVLDGTTTVAEYIYNGSGQRIKKILPTETRIFHYDLSGHIIAETNQSGQMVAEYIYLGDQLLAMIRPGETVYYYHNDHLGTPQILTDVTGAIAWKATYTPFGKSEISIETIENPFRLPGQYYDQETGLHYNYFRYYDPTTGRYVTPDPIELMGGMNLWPYVVSNPVTFIDPLGLWRATGHRTLTTGAMTGTNAFTAADIDRAVRSNLNVDRLSNQFNDPAHYMPGTQVEAEPLLRNLLERAIQLEGAARHNEAMDVWEKGSIWFKTDILILSKMRVGLPI